MRCRCAGRRRPAALAGRAIRRPPRSHGRRHRGTVHEPAVHPVLEVLDLRSVQCARPRDERHAVRERMVDRQPDGTRDDHGCGHPHQARDRALVGYLAQHVHVLHAGRAHPDLRQLWPVTGDHHLHRLGEQAGPTDDLHRLEQLGDPLCAVDAAHVQQDDGVRPQAQPRAQAGIRDARELVAQPSLGVHVERVAHDEHAIEAHPTLGEAHRAACGIGQVGVRPAGARSLSRWFARVSTRHAEPRSSSLSVTCPQRITGVRLRRSSGWSASDEVKRAKSPSTTAS